MRANYRVGEHLRMNEFTIARTDFSEAIYQAVNLSKLSEVATVQEDKGLLALAKSIGCSVDALDFLFGQTPEASRYFEDLAIPDMRQHR